MFQQTDDKDFNVMWSSRGVDPQLYDDLQEWQKINHFPGSTELTRKDRLITNIVQM